MITLNGTLVPVEKFFDGTQRIFNFPMDSVKLDEPNVIYWKYEAEEELVTLIYVMEHLRDKYYGLTISLVMPYIPNARMDRTQSPEQVFTLKWFCKILNSLEFSVVSVLDPHSNVSSALLNRVAISNPSTFIQQALTDIIEETKVNIDDFVIFLPDKNAFAKYKSLFDESIKVCYGDKDRNFRTGEKKSLEIIDRGIDLAGKTILMVDDIVCRGGTMADSATQLKDRGVKEVFAFATHVENSVLDEEHGTLLKKLQDGTVRRLYTTGSLYSGGESEYIKVI